MALPLSGLRFLATGGGPVVDAAAELLELLGADVVRVDEVHGSPHAVRAAGVDAAGAVDSSGLLDAPPFPVVRVTRSVDPDAAWAASGAAALTGAPHGPPMRAPGSLVVRLLGVGAVVKLLAACRAVVLELDALALLGERAAITGFTPQGTRSVGGACEVLAAADGWVALSLARPEDFDALPALLDAEAAPTDWAAVRAAVARRTRAELVERAALVGLALGAWPGPDGVEVAAPFRIDGAEPRRRLRASDASGVLGDAPARPLVVDLSSLWAGPLAGSLLAAAGARVIKVEGARRPDGARRGPAAFFALLNGGKECVALDFADERDRSLLVALLHAADVVIEASRPRVMASLGIDPAEVVRDGTTTWISITGHGREGDNAMRVAF
ncbi:MAG TPA: CoA transferase, partial [Acidimicrobiales bacterium]